MTGKSPGNRQPHPVDVHVGARVCLYRSLVGMSRKALGCRIGVSAQQVARYEDAGVRIAASRLVSIARALEVDVACFFRGCEGSLLQQKTAGLYTEADGLIHNIPDKSIRKDLVRLMATIGKAFHGREDTAETPS